MAHISNYMDLPTFARYKYNNKFDALSLPRRSRVVSIYEQHTGIPQIATNSKVPVSFSVKCAYFCSGTILEGPTMKNAWRYLIVYDQGSTAYCKPANVFPCIDLFGVPVNRLHADHVHLVTQIKLQKMPLLDYNKPSSHESFEDHVKVYFCGEWRNACIIDTDCSLVRVRLEVDFDLGLDFDDQMSATSGLTRKKLSNQYIYSFQLHRSSYCLWPMYERLLNETLLLVESQIQENRSNHFDHIYLVKCLNRVFSTTSSNSTSQAASCTKGEEKYLSVFASTQFPMSASDENSGDQLRKLVTLLVERSSQNSPQNYRVN